MRIVFTEMKADVMPCYIYDREDKFDEKLGRAISRTHAEYLNISGPGRIIPQG